jgi:hypothetical protein
VATPNGRDDARLTVEIEPALRQRVERAAAERGMALKDYVSAALHAAVASTDQETAAAWSRLSMPSFARDWESDADAVYDDLAAFDRGLRDALGLS